MKQTRSHICFYIQSQSNGGLGAHFPIVYIKLLLDLKHHLYTVEYFWLGPRSQMIKIKVYVFPDNDLSN